MATDSEGQGLSKSTLSKVALPAVVAAAGAVLGLLFKRTPQRLREAIPELPRGARDLIGDVKQRAESGGEASMPRASGNGSSSDFDEFEARRRERKERRERRRRSSTT
jgi:hypothetical protein